jgi:hypothetical protein
MYSMSRWLHLGAGLLLVRYLPGWNLLPAGHENLCYVSGWIDILLGINGMSNMPTGQRSGCHSSHVHSDIYPANQ